MINDIRNYYILYALFDSDERHPIACSFLSERLSLSNKTIHSNIEKMEDYCLEHGFRILSKSANGFYCEILDRKKANALRESLSVYFSNNNIIYSDTNLDLSGFVIYLINRLTPATIAELCDYFFVSKSKIYSYINETNILLKFSNLKLINDRERGIYIEGNEYFKRLFISKCVGTSIFQYDIDYLFGKDLNYKPYSVEQKTMISKILRRHGIVLTDEYFNIFQFMLFYTEYRYRLRLSYEIPEDYIQMSAFLSEYQAASEILEQLRYNCRTKNDEIMFIATFLLAFNVNIVTVTNARYGAFHYPRIMKLYEYLREYMDQNCSEFCTIPEYTDSLLRLACKMYFLKHYQSYASSISPIGFDLAITNNAMIRYVSRDLCKVIDQYFGLKMSFPTSVYVVDFIENLFSQAELEKNDIHILLILKNGPVFASHYISWLNTHLKPQPRFVDIMSLYEAETMNIDKYDLILTNYDNIEYVKENYRVFKINDPIDSHCEFVNEYYRLSNMRNISLEQIIQNFDHIFVYHGLRIEKTKDFIERLDNDLGDLADIPIRFLRNNITPINYYSGSRTIIVPFIFDKNNPGDHKRIMSIYFNEESSRLKYRTMVFVSMSKDEGIISLIRLSNIFNQFAVEPNIFQRIEKYVTAR